MEISMDDYQGFYQYGSGDYNGHDSGNGTGHFRIDWGPGAFYIYDGYRETYLILTGSGRGSGFGHTRGGGNALVFYSVAMLRWR
jgi:hypothetical protein